MTKVLPQKRHTIQSIGQKMDLLFDVVGQILVEQTAMKDDIAELKTDVSGLKTDNLGIKASLAALRSDFEDFRAEANQKFDYIQEDIRVILPDHELRIARLEGRSIAAA
jgi:hypothetical protein